MFVTPIIDGLIGLFSKGLEKWIPDANLRQQAAMELANSAHVQIMGQIALNQGDSANPSLFISGWRPFIGWVCGGAFSYNFVLQPFLVFILLASGVHIDVKLLPILDWSQLSYILLGMLGLGAYRTYEKVNGVAK